MADEIRIRAALPEDAAAVVRLVKVLAENEGEECNLTEAYARQYLAFPGSAALLAELAGQAIGLLSFSRRPNLYHAGDSALIEELVVEAGARGKGVGGRLVSALVDLLQKEGCQEVSVTTMPDNHGAIRFYRSHGFEDEAVYLERHFHWG